jgi:hypothetical protein
VLSGALTRAAGEAVGSYAISQGSLAANANYTIAFIGNGLVIARKALTVTGIVAEPKVYDGSTIATLSGNPALSGVIAGDDVGLASPVYDNSANDLFTRFEVGGMEVGDEISLASPANRVTRFSFEYWGLGGGPAGAFNGGVQVILRFYKNDGPLLTNVAFSARVPQTLIFKSKPFPISATDRSVLVYTEEADFTNSAAADVLLTGPLPSSFTWTVQFIGLGAGDTAGLDLYSPPTIGSSFPDYWEFNGSEWELLTYHAAPPINFGARLEAAVTGTFADKNAGANKAVTVSALTLNGADAGNYTLTQPTLMADITAREVTGSFTANNKVYDGNNSATIATRTVSGVLPEEATNVTPTGGTATFDNANAGTGKTVSSTPFTLTGSAAGNYALSAVANTTADIATLGVTGSFTVSNKAYDGTTAATVLTRTLNGVLAADAANVSLTGGAANFGDPNAGVGKTVSLGGVALSGPAAGNYNLISVNTAMADITRATLTATADDKSRAYGEPNPTFTISYNGFVGGDDAGDLDSLPTASTAATISSAPGNYPITLTGGADNNYAIVLVNGTLSITTPPPPVIISIGVNAGVATVTWNSIAGLQYKLQFKDNVTDTEWVDTTGTVTATGPTASAENIVGDLAQRFYRVVLLPTF